MTPFLLVAALVAQAAPPRDALGPLVGWTTHGPYGGYVRLTINPGTPGELFAEGLGEFRSTDSASSWRSFVIPGGGLIISPSNSQVLYTNGSRSDDGGFTWRPLVYPTPGDFPGHVYYSARTLAVDPTNADTVYLDVETLLAGDLGAHQVQIFRSTDGGLTWELIFSEGSGDLAGPNVYLGGFVVETANPSALHMTVFTNLTQAVLNSGNGGASWAPAESLPWTISNLATGSAGVLYASASGSGVVRSVDAGAHWSVANDGLPAEALAYAAAAVAPSNPSMLYASTSAGIFRSVDAGSRWSSTGATLVEGRLVVDPTDPSRLYYSGQHDEVLKSVDAGASWTPADAGLTALSLDDVAVDPFDSSTLFAAGRGGVVKSSDGGVHWTIRSAGLPPSPFGQRLEPDPGNAGVIYLVTGSSGIFRSDDSAETWKGINGGLPEPFLSMGIAIDPRDTRVLLAATEQGVFKTENGGQSWRASNAGILDGLPIVAVAIDGHLAFAATTQGLYKSVDGGVSWSLTAFPEGAATALIVLIDPRDASQIFAATPNGVWTSADAGQSWRPTAIVDWVLSLRLDSVAGALYAGTFDRILRSSDAGRTWTVIDRGLGGARALDVSGDRLYAAQEGAVYAIETRGTRALVR